MIEFSEMRGPTKIFGPFCEINGQNILFGPSDGLGCQMLGSGWGLGFKKNFRFGSGLVSKSFFGFSSI